MGLDRIFVSVFKQVVVNLDSVLELAIQVLLFELLLSIREQCVGLRDPGDVPPWCRKNEVGERLSKGSIGTDCSEEVGIAELVGKLR